MAVTFMSTVADVLPYVRDGVHQSEPEVCFRAHVPEAVTDRVWVPASPSNWRVEGVTESEPERFSGLQPTAIRARVRMTYM